MNPNHPPQLVGQIGLFNLGMATGLKEGKL